MIEPKRTLTAHPHGWTIGVEGTRSSPRSRAFTIIEVIVVIAVFAALLGLTFPALRAVKTASRQTVELNAAKHLMAAYINYAAVHNDRVLPGHTGQIPVDPNPGQKVYSLPAFDANGHSITGTAPGGLPLDVARKRYVWRLAPYLNYNMRGLYINEQLELLEDLARRDHRTYLYVASISPALGLNTEWMGGDEEYGFRPIDHLYRQIIDYNKYYLTATAQAFYPSRLLVFASARGVDPSGFGGGGIVEGYFKVQSPYFAHVNPACRWSANFHPGEEPVRYGYVSPRYAGKAVIGFLDGHADLLSKEQLRDMRHWANWATSEDWTLPAPPPVTTSGW